MQWNGASHCEYDGKSMETETTAWLEFPNRGKANVEHILAPEEINKSKRAELWESQSGMQVGKLNIAVRLIEIITEFTKSVSSTRISKSQSFWSMLKSPDKNLSRWVDWENLIYVRQNRIKNRAGIDRGKRSKTLSEVKPVKNISRNLQSFLEISPEQKEVHPSHKLQQYAYE